MESTLLEKLSECLGDGQLLTGEDVKSRYHHIWQMDKPLKAIAVALPKSTLDISNIMRICNEENQKVVVHGGLTNLVGGTETHGDELVIAMEKMNKIEEVDDQSRTMTVQAGVILETIQLASQEQNMFFPLNFGAKGSAQIGGIISTNAGGLRVFRFGMTRNLVLGLEAVLADGSVISSMKKIIKDNSAYDLKQMFIGSEGSLGIVSRAILKLHEASTSRNSALIAFNDYDKVVSFLKFIDAGLAGLLSGYELMWDNFYTHATSPPALSKPPLAHGYKYYVLIESLGSRHELDKASMQALLEQALEEELILDAVLADSQSDLDWFWKIREDVHVLASQCNNDQHFDISLPIPLIGDVINKIHDRLMAMPEVELVVIFGHVADGNIHLIVGKSEQNETLINQINETIYKPLEAIGGSISAEHGIGVHKKEYLSICRSQEELNLMRTMKRALDPKNLLNPNKVIEI